MENDEGDDEMWRHRGSATDFLASYLTTEENPVKPQETVVSGVLSNVTSLCLYWGPFPLNEVGRPRFLLC